MAVIPDVDVGHLRPDFKERIDKDKTAPRCIWCKSGAGKKKHQLVDCPNAILKVESRTSFSDNVLGDGHGDYAVAYIHQLQLEHRSRKDGKTPFSTGISRSTLTNTPDGPPPSATASSSVVASAAATTATTATSSANASAATASAPKKTIQVSTVPSSAPAVPAPTSVPAMTSNSSQGQQGAPVVPTAPSDLSAELSKLNVSSSQVDRQVPRVRLGDSATVPMHVTLDAPRGLPQLQHLVGHRYQPDETSISQKLDNVQDSHSNPVRKPVEPFKQRPKGQFHDPKKYEVLTNHFEIGVDPNVTFHEYRIVGIPDTERRAGKKRYMQTIIDQAQLLHTNQASFATDMIDTIISWKPLHESIASNKVFADEWSLIDIVDMNTTATINLRYIRPVDFAGLKSFTTSDNMSPLDYNIESSKNALNILLTKCIHNPDEIHHLNTHKFFVKSAYLDLKADGDSVEPLRALRGFAYTVKPGMGKILLNITPVTSLFWSNWWVSDVLRAGLQTFGGDRNVLKGVQVRIAYSRAKGKSSSSTIDDEHSRIRKIRGFGQIVSKQTFDLDVEENGIKSTRTVTVAKYLRDNYSLKVDNNDLAVDLGSEGKPSWFPAEQLQIVPGQIWARIVPDAIAEAFHLFSCQIPAKNRALIEGLAMSSEWLVRANTSSQLPSSFKGMVSLTRCPPLWLNPNMLQIPAARLDFPVVAYRNNVKAKSDENTGRWNLHKNQFLQGCGRSVNWKLLVEARVDHLTIQNVQQHFGNQLRVTGVCSGAVHNGPPHILHNGISEGHIRAALQAMHNSPAGAPEIVVLLLHTKDQGIYSSFKYLADRVFGIHAICVTRTKFRPKGYVPECWSKVSHLQQYMANVAMKANLKVRGINHTVTSLSQYLKNTMLVGADLTHAGSGAIDNCPSIAAVVGSTDQTAGRFYGHLFLQRKSDMIADFEEAIIELLVSWFDDHRKQFPKNILYYRDGVSNSQYADVETQELSCFPAAFRKVAEICGANCPDIKVTTIIVTKRHSTRFFPARAVDQTGPNGNCRPGTLVDSAVTSPYFSDFYLQSQNAIKGTARPCHYYVLRNEMGLTVPELQALTHQLCHTYVRATLGVSYAPPAYYADRLCERSRCYLREWYSPSLATKQAWGSRKSKHKRDVAAEREKRGQALSQRKKGVKKTKAEMEAEDEDFNDVGQRMYRDVLKACRDRLDAHCADGAERRVHAVRQTMYWM